MMAREWIPDLWYQGSRIELAEEAEYGERLTEEPTARSLRTLVNDKDITIKWGAILRPVQRSVLRRLADGPVPAKDLGAKKRTLDSLKELELVHSYVETGKLGTLWKITDLGLAVLEELES